ncbi:phosphoethanolamine--lipid A transferase [Ottowia beijingensis]|uniref:phosphoethanolamine transferase n=1 Tax=Ottowia beijingensis TaxID=1207057 RepID=UPI002FDB0A0A
MLANCASPTATWAEPGPLTRPPRGALRPATAIILAALWIASIANLALWRALAGLPELANGRGLAFGIGFGVMIAAAHVALLSLLAWRWTLKPALALFLLSAAGGAYFMLSYGVVIDRTMMVNVLLTDTREARELLSWRLLGALLLLGVLPLALLWRTPLRWATPLRQAGHNAILLVAACALLAGAGGLFFQDLSATMRNHTQLRYLINPLNSFYAIAIMGRKPIQRSGVAVAPLGEDAHLPALAAGARPPLVIMVLGETARADHLGLNGYARDTTPRLAQENVVSLRNVWSCGTNTAASVPCMFSNLGREAFENRQTNTEGLVDVLQRAGLAVLWLDNQAGGCKGVCDRVPKVDYRQLQATAPELCADDECFDEIMLRGLDERIAQLPAERRARGVVVFMHQMGSHGPAYYKRTPAGFKKFMPECTTNALQQCPREQVVNAYDNTLLYTDHFLASTIDWLKQRDNQWAPAMVYLSDHGESLGENNLYLHGLPYRFAPDVQKHVPWIFWLSPTFEQQSGVKLDFLARQQGEKLSHDHYFHSTLGLLGVQTQVHDPARDVFTSCRAGAA